MVSLSFTRLILISLDLFFYGSILRFNGGLVLSSGVRFNGCLPLFSWDSDNCLKAYLLLIVYGFVFAYKQLYLLAAIGKRVGLCGQMDPARLHFYSLCVLLMQVAALECVFNCFALLWSG